MFLSFIKGQNIDQADSRLVANRTVSTSLSFSKKLAIFKHYFHCVMIHIFL